MAEIKLIFRKKHLPEFLQTVFLSFVVFLFLFLARDSKNNPIKSFLGMNVEKSKLIVEFIPTPTFTPTPSPTPTPKPKVASDTDSDNPSVLGVAKQLSKYEWTIKLGHDLSMASPSEILTALNSYRQLHGAGNLSWSDSLASFAQQRANSFVSNETLDQHKGFNEYFDNVDNFKNSGFTSVGENSSIGYQLEAAHLIEWVYAADEGHNLNQLNPKWTHVGIGVNATATDLVFGG